MGFYEFLNKTRSRPDKQKQRMLVGVAAIATVLLGAVWLSNIRGQFAQNRSPFSLQPQETEVKKIDTGGGKDDDSIIGPFRSLGQGLALFVADLRDYSEEFLSTTDEIVSENTGGQKVRPIYKLPTVNGQ